MTSDLERTRVDARTRVLLEGPILSTLMRLATPNVLVMLMQASVGLIETYFVGKLGTDALAGVTLVFPVLMLMQMMSAGAMGGGISSAVRARSGAGRRADADALAFHALVIALRLRARLHRSPSLGGGPTLYAAMGGREPPLAAALTYSNVVFSAAVMVWTFNSLANVIRGTGNMLVPAVRHVGRRARVDPVVALPDPRVGPVPAPRRRRRCSGGGGLLPWSERSLCCSTFGPGVASSSLSAGVLRLRWTLFRDILRVGYRRCAGDDHDESHDRDHHRSGGASGARGDRRLRHRGASRVSPGTARVRPRAVPSSP